jgi:S1-C subfamily serine protease/TolA-binding protein
MRVSRPAVALTALLLALSGVEGLPGTLAAQDQNTRIQKKLAPSVVAIRNPEGYGSGMILDAKGLVLTNAHVICSPLPFHVQAVGTIGTETKSLTFNNVTLLGVHPEYDLALLQIDPSEHRATLKPVTTTTSTITSGDPIWAIGFPSDVNAGRTKFMTWGKVKSTNRTFQGDPNYIEMDVSLYFGNSGGPICDGNGDVVGVATAIAEDGNTLAVPIGLVRPDRFVPLRQRRPNHGVSSMLIGMAEKEIDSFMKGRGGSLGLAIMAYEQALLYDAGNAALYAKIGQFNFLARRQNFAVAYFVRSIQIQPWADNGADVYRQLGLCFASLKKEDEAILIWKEGLAKYPMDNSQLWDEVAIILLATESYYEAACAARTALKCYSKNPDYMNEVYKKAREKMPPETMGKLREYENGIDAMLAARKAEAERARKDGKEHLTPGMEKLMSSVSGVQQSGTLDLSKLGFKRELPKLNVSDAELTQLFVRSRVDAAGELLLSGKLDLAVKTLEDVIETYPDHPETQAARDLLGIIKRKMKK